ncbi:MAG: ABC transporter ATP-binding protein [Bacteroidales bacterium]|nr:ABC transporter ATP-binding protein [Bacteroidales bacterium]
MNNKALIVTQNLTKRFKKLEVVKKLSIRFSEGERVALIGQNGAGKTSLIRCILGHYVYEGSIEVLGKNPRKERVEILKEVGFVPQIPPPLKMTVGELMSFYGKLSNTPNSKFIEICENLGLSVEHNFSKPFFKLSGGMKQKLLLSFAIGKSPQILLLDEPSANLDPKAREVLFEYLDNFRKDGLMILSSHRLNEISTLVNRLIEMDLGNIVVDKTMIPASEKEFVFKYQIRLSEKNEELENLLTTWKFKQNSEPLHWEAEIDNKDVAKLSNILNRFTDSIKSIETIKKE